MTTYKYMQQIHLTSLKLKNALHTFTVPHIEAICKRRIKNGISLLSNPSCFMYILRSFFVRNQGNQQ